MVARYNADLANNLGNLLSRVATVVAKKCGGIGPAPAARQPARRGRRRRPTRDAAAAWDAVQPSVALEATWRLIREANALLEAAEPWKAEPGPEVDGVLGDALEVLRLVAILASPALTRAAGEVWRRIGLERLARRPAAARRRRPGAATPAACRSRRAPRCSPGSSRADRRR